MTLQDAREEAKARGSDHAWRVQKDYCIDGGVLKIGQVWPRGYRTLGPSHWYYPFAHPELVTAVAQLTKGDERAVLEFAYQWGLLGYDRLIPYHPGWEDGYDKGEWVTRTEERRGGDPIAWIWAHAETVRRILRLIRLLAKCADAEWYAKDTKPAKAPEKELGRYLSSIAQPFSPSGMPPNSYKTEDGYTYTAFHLAIGIEPIETIPGIRVASGVTVVTSPQDTKWGDPMTPQRMANEIIAGVINGNLVGMSPLVLNRYPEDSRMERAFTFPALISAVYWHLSDAAIGGRTFIQCQRRGCGKWILREHGHQRYCPPQAKGMESLCSLKARQDKWIRSQREGVGREADNGEAQA